jgi:HD-GYP domain-containing protein (c-di-GMP phosphodiesterase class II)
MDLKGELERLFQASDASAKSHSAPMPMLSSKGVPIETLIDIVQNGGEVKTGIDVFNRNGVLLLEKNTRIKDIKQLLIIRQNGIFQVPISPSNQGGLWDAGGREIELAPEDKPFKKPETDSPGGEALPPPRLLETRIRDIREMTAEAAVKFNKAKENIRKTVMQIKESGGFFDLDTVQHTVADLTDFLLENENAFSFLTREIFLADDFLFNHSINVCTIGTTVLRQFNTHFSRSISDHLRKVIPGAEDPKSENAESFICYSPEEIQDMAIGFFIHDIGKTIVPEHILNKTSRLTEKEQTVFKAHSYQRGVEILNKNDVSNPFIRNIVKNHHAALYSGENEGYPLGKAPNEIPAYVKICKLADIYDTMTSMRHSQEALNPIRVVTSIIRTYANKDPVLQFILHAFISAVGIWPPGSIVYLKNRQMAYVIDSKGPIVLPFTDTQGQPLKSRPDFIDFGGNTNPDTGPAIDSRDPLISPKEVYQMLPPFLRNSLFADAGPNR